LDCRIELENRYDRIIRGMVYPDTGVLKFWTDNSYETVKGYLKDLGIAYARILNPDNEVSFDLPTDWYSWTPTARHANPDIKNIAKRFLELDSNNCYCASRSPKLFYLWGHSYEFDRENNWELLDELCQLLGNKDDIYYATNIEIHDYVKAYNSLIYSADNHIVYNPTIIKIWFVIDGKNYSIEPRETIRI